MRDISLPPPTSILSILTDQVTPSISSFAVGFVVPIPILPQLVTVSLYWFEVSKFIPRASRLLIPVAVWIFNHHLAVIVLYDPYPPAL